MCITDDLAKPIRQLQRSIELSVADPRNQALISYPLSTLSVIIVLARMSGCENMTAAAHFYAENKEKLKKYIYGLGDESPTAQTLRQVQSILDGKHVLEYFSEYFVNCCIGIKTVDTEPELKDRDVISCDGQNIRATRSTSRGDKRKSTGYDIVQMYSHKYGITLSQKITDKKNHEAQAIIEMLPMINAVHCIFTWDAINTQHKTLKAVTEAGGDFIVCVKSNQGTLYEEIVTAFEYELPDEAVSAARTSSGHGRIEQKDIAVLPVELALTKEMRRKWPDIATVICVNTTRYIKSSGKEQTEKRYFISSIEIDYDDEDYASQIQDVILLRWQVEVSHWYLDMCFMQDRLPLRNRDYINNHTYFTKMAFNILSYVKNHCPEDRQGRTPSMASLQYACRDAETAIRFCMAYVTQDKRYFLEDERLYLLKILKRPAIKDDYVEPKPEIPENGMARLAMLGRKGIKAHG